MERVEGDSKIERRLKTNVEEIKDTSVVVQKEGKKEEIEGVDMVVVAQGAIANNDLADKLSFDSTIPEIYTVGDCVIPRKMTEAIYEGSLVGRQI